MKKLFALLPLLLVLSCATKLAPEGVYHGDKVLFEADQTLVTGYQLLDAFVAWEKQFRPMLPPEVKKAADNVRANAKQWFKTGFALRDAYMASPSDTTALALQTGLRVINAALLESAGYLSKYGPQKPQAQQGDKLTPLAAKIQLRDGTNFIGQYMGMIAEWSRNNRKWDAAKQCACGEPMPDSVMMFSATSGECLRWISAAEFRRVYIDKSKPEYPAAD